MKKTWQKLAGRIDALTLRERAIIFAMAAGFIIFITFFLVLNPAAAKQRRMLQDMSSQRDQIAGIEAEIARTIAAHTLDPDAAERARLAATLAQSQALSSALMAMQQGMVPPERMTQLLGRILRGHGGLRLRSLRSLGEDNPAIAPGVVAPPAATPVAGAAPSAADPPGQLLHRHGVELVVQGSYSDMVSYMAALEKMQGQIFWGQASLVVDTYPDATLTLVVYTISLDKKWLKL